MTHGERQLLIDLADEYPALSDELCRRLEADNRHRWETEAAIRARDYDNWRVKEVKRLYRRRKLAARLGPVIAVLGLVALFWVVWLTFTDNGGGLSALAFCVLLSLYGAGTWLESKDALKVPPTNEELGLMSAGYADVCLAV
jgi:hypothetical protein